MSTRNDHLVPWTLVSRRPVKDPPSKNPAGWHIFHTYSVGYDVISPVNNAYLQGTCGAAPAGWSCDPKMEELRMAWARESDPDKRNQLTADIQKRAYEMTPFVNFGQYFWPMA